MAKFVFSADRPMYYPTLGLRAEPGMTRDFESAPDGHWRVSGASSEPAPTQTPAVTPADAVAASEAPALAAQIATEVAQNA